MAKQPTEKQLAARAAGAERFRKMHAEKKSAKVEKKSNIWSGPNVIPIDSLYSPDGNGTLKLDKVTPGTVIHGSQHDFSNNRIEQLREHVQKIGTEFKFNWKENGMCEVVIYAKEEA